MNHRITVMALATLAAWLALPHAVKAEDPLPSYKISLKADAVREFQHFSVQYKKIELKGSKLSAIPIECEAGVTGVVLIGDGTYRFAPEGADPIAGHFKAAMLRFNPKDQATLLPLDKATIVTDYAVHEMSRHLLNDVFRHCWHSGMEALIPEEGTLAVVVYSKEHGDLLMSVGKEVSIAYSFTDRKQLYPNK